MYIASTAATARTATENIANIITFSFLNLYVILNLYYHSEHLYVPFDDAKVVTILDMASAKRQLSHEKGPFFDFYQTFPHIVDLCQRKN